MFYFWYATLIRSKYIELPDNSENITCAQFLNVWMLCNVYDNFVNGNIKFLFEQRKNERQ